MQLRSPVQLLSPAQAVQECSRHGFTTFHYTALDSQHTLGPHTSSQLDCSSA